MKMRRHRIVLVLLMAGLCLISFMHFLKALSYITFSRELSSFTPSLRSIFVDSQFLWKESVALREAETEPAPLSALPPSPPPGSEEPYRATFHMRDERTEYFVRTRAGAVCFKHGTKREVRSMTGSAEEGRGPSNRQPTRRAQARQGRRRRWVGCVCRPGWHGPSCGVPTLVQYSNLPTKDRLSPRRVPRRLINAININHEFDLLNVRFHELGDVVDVFMVCESNFTAYGDPKPLLFLEMLRNGTYDQIRHKVLYVFLDHFPSGGRQDGWIADDYLRTFLTRDGLRRMVGVRADDIFVINDADEIPARDGLLFLKLFDGWTEPFGFHLRKSLYGFFWKQPGTLEVVAGCTVGMLRSVYEGDGIKLRRREYYLMPSFRQYENATGHILVQWSLGSALHFAGWHCSWCFTPEGIRHKLVSAQNGDFPRWGNYQEKRELSYIRELIQTGGWFDGTLQEYPPADPKEQMYAPKYLLKNFDKYRYILENPYRNEGAESRDLMASNGSSLLTQLPPQVPMV
ncbi:beta-1,4-mannosyl-glycoprotein 4-beta-N-acetylglucosaminyltransferase [Callorhinchus milii]|uniref:Beta-1,4-mannosyl-glycoprotein 4-beta-N-acetylglucosaminyltransferase a n=1 Tax=Callorhinchus milii TaxID=7868 RepID=A0A4W3GNM5_CALMI|nr:beta-1,4-mannosyl-glycoprotein 4-beta-N-acetylglucosaminyltransferase [Callorhinchus milii]|eukprot:gi/632989254/ref/XP_007883549.1/ PREDICTED: beta-1,4-mannosyl-glycoprotein 4-beta-N-acetylglucosaminyltransferase [Callorhinchus milii]